MTETPRTPWDEHPKIWKNSTAFFTWLRSNTRKSLWSRSPIKHEFIHNNRKLISNPNPKGRKAMVWGAECALCHKDFTMDQIEVDHIIGEHKLSAIEDIQSFIEKIVMVRDSELQLLCSYCHKAKSYSDKSGLSFDDAVVEKEVIERCKLPVASQIEILQSIGLPCSNAKQRRNSMREIVKNKFLFPY